MRAFPLALTLLLTCLPLASAFAGSLRCNHRLIDEGMSRYEVSLHCGEPDAVETILEPVEVQLLEQTTYYPAYHAQADGRGEIDSVTKEPRYRKIERWTYQPGSGKFIQEVDFLAGKVLRITSLGRAP